MVFADTEKCDILSHRIITNIYTKDASDHFPVYADISFKS
jgi:endonuclease/exonuclease/phosphatase family metal-dependent hydrolase